MPSIAAHLVVAKLVGDILKIEDPNFIKGNILPDITNNKDSHHKIKGKNYLIPDIDYLRKILNLNSNLELGYFVHILLDKYFLEEFVPNKVSDLDVFKNGTIYNDYDQINFKLVKKYNLDVDFLSKLLVEINNNIDYNKLKYNIDCLNSKIEGSPKYFDLEEFSKFLECTSNRICEVIKSDSKFNRSIICIRQREK